MPLRISKSGTRLDLLWLTDTRLHLNLSKVATDTLQTHPIQHCDNYLLTSTSDIGIIYSK